MATPNPLHSAATRSTFEFPKVRQLLVVIGLIWLSLVAAITFAEAVNSFALDFTDPLFSPFSYLVLFGGSCLWILIQYRRHNIPLQSIWGNWPTLGHWRSIVGLWITLFMFSIGAFQVSFVLLSYGFPELVERLLQESIFLSAGDTAIPWLYNLLMLSVLVIAAPVLEEFLFRGFLLHRWGMRWSPQTGVILSSVLFGILHSNIIGLGAFGLAMALLYLRSGSLGLVIIIHSLNNAIAASLEIIVRFTSGSQPPSLEDFRTGLWFGILLLAVATPLLIRFIRRNWPVTQTALPYFAHCDRTSD